ncbi:MAG: translation initiation factor IF-2 [Sandaracinus sp.]
MSKVRVYEVARELSLENNELMKRLATLGIQVRNHMSALDATEVDRVKRAIEKDKTENTVETKLRAGVVRRRTVAQPAKEEAVAEVAPRAPEPTPPPAPRVVTPRVAPKVEPVVEEAAPPPPPPVEAVRQPEPEPTPPPPPVRVEAALPPPPPPEPTPPPPPPPEPIREVEIAAPPPPPVRRSQPAPASERFAHANLPPGVLSRGNLSAPSAAPPSLETRARIVTQAQNQQLQRPSYAPQPPGQRRHQVIPASGGARPGPGGAGPRPGMGGGRPGRPGKASPGPGKPAKPQITVPSAQKRVIRIEENISLQQLAQRMSLKATEVLMKLMTLGMGGVNINSTLDSDTAKILASEFGYEVENVAKSDDELVAEARGAKSERAAQPRPPIVTVMGHVDHGKTSLLDRIRKTNVAAGEAGGITQHIGAYRVETPKGAVVFLDTPGHEAFTAMRARGAEATDVVVLVVAADDGVMPQTREAVAHARAAEVPIIVAVNKIDKPGARPDQIRNELAGLGLNPEEWGGDTLYVNVSALTGQGVDELLTNIALQTEIMELSANAEGSAEGVVLEAYLDKGRGVVANVLVQNGTLNQGDLMLAGTGLGRIRALTDDRGRRVKSAGPATPVEVLGLPDLPSAGDSFVVVSDQRKAQEIVEARKKAITAKEQATVKRSLADVHKMLQAGETQDLNLVIKSDVQGSVEALVKALTELSTDKVRVNVIGTGVGGITESDVMLASASKAIIVGFNVRPAGQAAQVAKSEGVEIRNYSIIYEAVDEVKKAMEGLLAPTFRKKELGRAEVRKVFNIPKIGTVAGCYVLDGVLKRNAKVRLVRDSVQVWEGSLASLRRVKDDVREVANGFECGVGLENYNDVHEKDVIECFELEQISATL